MTPEEKQKLINNKGLPEKTEYEMELRLRHRNATFRNNQEKILLAIQQYIESNSFLPDVSKLAELTGLSRTTIYTHLRELNLQPDENLKAQQMQLLRERLLLKMYQKAFSNIEYCPQAARMFLQYSTPQKTTNNFIQINNVFINPQTIEALPEEKRKAIEAIILEANAMCKLL